MADQFTDLLSDYLDDEELAGEDRRRIAAHLAGCAECRATLADLREVTTRATALADTPPEGNLWPGVAARIGAASAPQAVPLRATRSAVRRISFTVPQLVAAGLALMLLSGGTVWLARLGGPRTDFEPLSAQFAPAQVAALREVKAPAGEWDAAIADLQRTLDAGRAQLAPETLRALESNLQAIDLAIEQCRVALAADPSSVYLNTHLANAQRRKLALLRRASSLAAARS